MRNNCIKKIVFFYNDIEFINSGILEILMKIQKDC